MQYSPKSPQYCRDKAIEYLKRGRDLFNSKSDVFQREAGYEMFKKGIEKMIEFAKIEKDPNLTQILKDQLKESLQEARMMESVLTQIPEKEEEDDNTKKKSQSILSIISKPKQPKKAIAIDKKALDLQEELCIEEKFFVTEKFSVDWSDIPDSFVKRELEEMILTPLKHQSIFTCLENPWRNILVYGLPGTGKTYLLKSLASKFDCTLLWASSCDLCSRYLGDSEKIMRNMFKYALSRQPAVILIDEIDCLFQNDGEGEFSRRLITEMYLQMIEIQNQNANVVFIGLTNNPVKLGQSVKKFDKKIYVPLPDQLSREVFFRKTISKVPNALKDEDFQSLAELTEGCSFSDIAALVKDAHYEPLRALTKAQFFKVLEYKNNKPLYGLAEQNDPEAIPMTLFDIPPESIFCPPVNMNNFSNALKKFCSSISKEYAEKFERDTRELFSGEEKEE